MSSDLLRRWAPTALLGVGTLFILGIDVQKTMPLEAPLDAAIPQEIEGYHGRGHRLSEGELQMAAATDYLLRTYAPQDSSRGSSGFSLYIGYYAQQSQGRTIHSPKNCLPGAGWQVLASQTAPVSTESGTETVNRYVLQRGEESALVLYWYQGRGRVEANEYVVKWDLLRDSALRGRSEEALVRIVVPIVETEEAAFARARRVAATVMEALEHSLPS